MPGTAHRLFLAALIIASKFSNDICPRNKSWVHASAGLFEIDEVNLMEKQFLFLLDFDLMFDEEEAISHFQPVLEVLGADLKDVDSYNKAKKEYNIKHAPPLPKKATLSFNPFYSGDSKSQVVRRAVVDDEKERLATRESALRRVARGSQERMARLPRSSLKQALSVAAPAPVLVVPPRSSSRFAPAPQDFGPTKPLPLRPSRSSIRPAIPSSVSFRQSEHISPVLPQGAASNHPSRPAALGTVLARGPSTDSISSDSMGGLTADEGTSSSSVSLSEEELDDEQDENDARIIRVVASLQMAVDEHTGDCGLESAGIGTTGVEVTTSSKPKWYGALQQPQPRESDVGGGGRRSSRFGWTRRRSDSLKPPCSAGDERRQVSQTHSRMDRNYQLRGSVESIIDLDTADQKDSSRRHSRSSRSAFSSSASTIVGSSEIQMTTGPAPIGAAPTNRHASCATITPSRSRVPSFGSMGIPITTASASTGYKQHRSDRAVSSSTTGGTKNAGFGMSISASIRNFLVGGGGNRDRDRVPLVPVET
jgi:hypothetical protein